MQDMHSIARIAIAVIYARPEIHLATLAEELNKLSNSFYKTRRGLPGDGLSRKILRKLPVRYSRVLWIETSFDCGHDHEWPTLYSVEDPGNRRRIDHHWRPLWHVAPVAHDDS